MTRHSEIVAAGEASIETYVDGNGAEVIKALAVEPAVVLGHAFGNFVARATAVHHRDMVDSVILAAASGETVAPEIDSAPMRAGNLTLSDDERLAALRMAFFAPGHDASAWLSGWHPETSTMQVDCVQHADIAGYWGAGDVPIFEVIAALDPFHQPREWGNLRNRYGARVTTTVIADASHALFPEQPTAVANAITNYLADRAALR